MKPKKSRQSDKVKMHFSLRKNLGKNFKTWPLLYRIIPVSHSYVDAVGCTLSSLSGMTALAA